MASSSSTANAPNPSILGADSIQLKTKVIRELQDIIKAMSVRNEVVASVERLAQMAGREIDKNALLWTFAGQIEDLIAPYERLKSKDYHQGFKAVQLMHEFHYKIKDIEVPEPLVNIVLDKSDLRVTGELQRLSLFRTKVTAAKTKFMIWLHENFSSHPDVYKYILSDPAGVQQSIETELGRIGRRVGRRYYGGMKWAAGY